jgi:hypothetical protein
MVEVESYPPVFRVPNGDSERTKNLIYTVIRRQIRQAESFSAMVEMARVNLGSYIRFISVLKIKYWKGEKKDIEKIQLDLFQNWEGVVLKT